MSRTEKAVLALVLLAGTRSFAFSGGVFLVPYLFGSDPSLFQTAQWQAYVGALNGLVDVAAAAWIYVEASAASLRKWLWPFLGLCFGPLGVVLFFGAQIYSREHSKT